jgi:hypothetical protein
MTDNTQDVSSTSGSQQENAGSQNSIPQELKNALDLSFQEQMSPAERQEFQQRLQGVAGNKQQPLRRQRRKRRLRQHSTKQSM